MNSIVGEEEGNASTRPTPFYVTRRAAAATPFAFGVPLHGMRNRNSMRKRSATCPFLPYFFQSVATTYLTARSGTYLQFNFKAILPDTLVQSMTRFRETFFPSFFFSISCVFFFSTFIHSAFGSSVFDLAKRTPRRTESIPFLSIGNQF